MLAERKIYLPTIEEDNAINIGIISDPDTMEVSDADFNKLKPIHGRSTGNGTKISTTVRFDADIIAAFRSSGKGWQTRMNNALRDWLQSHSPA
ncbi:MAG: BrnA antitoxin family protein [Magnetococcus sp. DMHC-6]